jgi:glycosyltransferase involved in cell wall biosynthesis
LKYEKTIAVNTRFLLKGRLEGIGNFTYETLLILVREHPEVHFYFLFDRAYDPQFIFAPNITPVVLFPQARHPFLFIWWFEWSVANWLNKHRPDLFLSPDGFCSLRSPVKQLAVIHDISYEHYPQYVSRLQNMYYRHFIPRFARHATRIATVSEFSKNDIAAHYAVPEDKTDVVYNGIKEQFRQRFTRDEQQRAREKYAGGKPFFLYVGAIHPRKNVVRMLQAFELFKAQTASNLQFVLAGNLAWQNKEVHTFHQAMTYKADVRFTGRVEEESLPLLISSAFALLYVSLFEGFGVPPVEAMACGTPVITSTTSSMPEICGDGALFANPESAVDIAGKMIQLSDNPSLANELIEKGYQRAKLFTWKRSAGLLWQSITKAAG